MKVSFALARRLVWVQEELALDVQALEYKPLFQCEISCPYSFALLSIRFNVFFEG